jgi:hypothetical protein
MFPADEDPKKIDGWKDLEDRLSQVYQNDERKSDELSKIENIVEEVPGILLVESTG